MHLRQSFLHDSLGVVEVLSHPGHLMGTSSCKRLINESLVLYFNAGGRQMEKKVPVSR